MADKRLTPARPDLAAAHLKGQVTAPRFVEGEKITIARGRVCLRAEPSPDAEQQTELLLGEDFTVYENSGGWAWGQAAADGYVGYIPVCAPLARAADATHRVTALFTPALSRPDVKAAARDLLPMNARLRVEKTVGAFAQTQAGFVGWVHLAPVSRTQADFVAVAQRFAGAAYVWGGKTFAGLDCSGLIQTALAASGIAAPRDTDMMQAGLGRPVPREAIRRGDLVFWKGHMGVMLDGERLLHANAFHLQVAEEPLADAIARIAKTAGAVTAIKRL